jgi:hypothetical protein
LEGNFSAPLKFANPDPTCRRLGFRELLIGEQIALPFDCGWFVVKHSILRSDREELKRLLRATIAADGLAIQEPAPGQEDDQ